MEQQEIVTLLVKIGVATSLASFGVRGRAIKRLLSREDRTLTQRMNLALWFVLLFLPGVAIRVLTKGYPALDLGLEGTLLAGITGGYVCGWMAGMMISIPAMLSTQILTLPVYALVGLGGGLLRDSATVKEEVWTFSPFPDVNVYRIFQHGREFRSALFHFYFTAGVLATEFLRQALGAAFRGKLFTLAQPGASAGYLVALYATTYFCITLPLKVWNNTRNEAKLEEQQRLLMQARLDALSSQINPHFLFNTLNSISSLIRVNPEKARTMVVRLARVMRRRLRAQEHFAPLRDELDFIEDYLSIETVRFGDKLRVIKDVDPGTLDALVPSMLLQPLVENSIKHGISGKVDGGAITLRTRRQNGRLWIEVEDDGVGIPEAELAAIQNGLVPDGAQNRGIGVKNVRERLKVLYSHDYRMLIESRAGKGTRIEIEVPVSESLAAVS